MNINESLAYIRYKNIDEDDMAVVTLYSYITNVRERADKIAIVYDNISETMQEALLSIHDVQFVKLGKECKKLLNNYPNNVDITGLVFEPTRESTCSKDRTDMTTNPVEYRIAVVCYVFYTEFYQQMYNYVHNLSSHLNRQIDMYVYYCDVNSAATLKRMLVNRTAGSKVNVIATYTQNTGRDVRTFLKFIKQKLYLNYDYICKIHTKKTTYLTDDWRGIYLDRLLEPAEFKNHIKKLDHTPLKISSVDKFKVHEKFNYSNINYKHLSNLNKKLNLQLTFNNSYVFYAGTMFWCTPAWCENIDNIIDDTHTDNFEQEPIRDDGSLAHAWERTFSII